MFNVGLAEYFEIIASGGIPDINNPGFGNPVVIITVVLLSFSAMLPCLVWFLRNFIRIVLKKNYELFNRSFKWIMLFSFVVFVISIILMILALNGVI
ncbi:MAG: hypothetical protein KFW07_01760 [Mycoplasmataceae bacterium]|nr:hypothetical protein [Mycoplasmataceae bacterium]